MFIFDVCLGSLGISIFGNSSSAANNTQSRLPSRLSFRGGVLTMVQYNIITGPVIFTQKLSHKKTKIGRKMQLKLF